MKAFSESIGYSIDEETLRNIDLHFHRSFVSLPEMAVLIASYTVKQTFTRQARPPSKIKNNIRFFFHNVFDSNEPPYVRVSAAALTQPTIFRAGTRINIVLVIIDPDYLRTFLKADADRFSFLSGNYQPFLIEEILTDDILQTVNAFLRQPQPDILTDYHYKLKALELLYHLFRRLSYREAVKYRKLSQHDLNAVYAVRDVIVNTLSEPPAMNHLRQLAGMNEVKLRALFKQVFGTGIYEYFQQRRIQEAARLLREGERSVSEVGYALGFENLSHFTRQFEKYIGMKPKRYSMVAGEV